MSEQDISRFFTDHCAAGGLVLVRAIRTAGNITERFAIFSSYEKARAWGDSLDDDWGCIYSPYIVDDPEWGERTRQ